MKKNNLIVLLLAALVMFAACNSGQKQFIIEGTTQGSYFRINYVADKEDTILVGEINRLLSSFENIFSLWNDSSELCKINRNENMKMSPIFKDVFEKSQLMSERTNGYFDITVKPLVSLYGFAVEKRTENYFSDETIASAKKNIGYKKVYIENNTVIKQNPEIQLDFNAMAQGYCADMVAEFLLSKNINNFIVDIAGEIVVRGKKANGESWQIGIEKPTVTAEDKQSIITMLSLQDSSIVTSGNYRKYFEVDGKRFSHTINPHTGRPTSDGVLSVTIKAATAWEADALSTAIMCMGKDTAISYAERTNTRCMIIYDSLGNYKTWQSENF